MRREGRRGRLYTLSAVLGLILPLALDWMALALGGHAVSPLKLPTPLTAPCRGGAKARREGLLNFKMRVLSLLEAYAKKAPASPLLPAALQPLLGALALACKPGAHKGLADRLSGLILNRICKGKAEASGAAGVPADVLATQLRRALYLASRSTEKRVAAAAAAGYVYLQRVAAGGGEGGVSAAVRAGAPLLGAGLVVWWLRSAPSGVELCMPL